MDEQKSSEDQQYRALVIDSGPIIKHALQTSSLFGKAQVYVTVPGVLEEIRDAKARRHLEQWPMELVVKTPSKQSMQRIIEFSKQTGDFTSLSSVDLQVCALVLDMEQEGTLTLDHLRTTPKRTIGLGAIQALNNGSKNSKEEVKTNEEELEVDVDEDEDDEDDEDDDDVMEEKERKHDQKGLPNSTSTSHVSRITEEEKPKETLNTKTEASGPKTWAMLVNPTAASTTASPVNDTNTPSSIPHAAARIESTDDADGGQFEDAEEEEEEVVASDNEAAIRAELQMDFPSLSAAATVPYEGSDDEVDNEGDIIKSTKEEEEESKKSKEEEDRERKKQQALEPISKSGKLYNSFTKYGKLMKKKDPSSATTKKMESKSTAIFNVAKDEPKQINPGQSRIMGTSTAFSSDMNVEDDDGEGWITCTKDISKLKVATNGRLEPTSNKNASNKTVTNTEVGPPLSKRAACTTTDFAIQNVLLQMGCCLVNVDGVAIRRLKSWVTRCGACFRVETGDGTFLDGKMKRLFCSHCGSDMMQRIAASVDGKTGRLKLHLSKKYKHNLRGTKFSLPKAGTGNRFQGDLLLREDQLLTGVWNQKVKMKSGGQSRAPAQSMFGKDLATTVGCHANDGSGDWKTGFGRRNPNAAKGRERRGKKKKSSDRACGLRRY